MNTFERNFGKCFILECAYTLECSKIYGVPKLLALQYMHEFINEMLLIVVIEANGSVEIIITCDSN